MKTLMYPIAPEDDFPNMFCAIRPYSGEQQFYAPEGERTNAMLSRMNREAMEKEEAINSLTDGNQRLRIENAKLRELIKDMVDYGEGAGTGMADYFADRMRGLGVIQ